MIINIVYIAWRKQYENYSITQRRMMHCKDHGESNFTIEILEKLKYDEDETKADYNQELNILKLIWEDSLS